MINTQYINLNMTPSGVLPVLHCSQYDIGRPLGVVVYDGSAEMDLDDYTVTIEATRTDGTPITAAVTTDGNIGAFATTATMTNKDDLYPAQLVIVDGDSNRVASLSFMMRVVKAAMDENSEAIEEDAPLYQQYNAAIQALIAAVRADLNVEVAARKAAVSAEASARSLQDAVLQAQIDQLIAPSGSAPSAAEVQDARIGADGVTYTTLGNAIRTQNSNLKSAINAEFPQQDASVFTWTIGKSINSSGSVVTALATAVTDLFSAAPGSVIYNMSNKTGMNDKDTIFYVHQYANNVWQKRTLVPSYTPITLDSTTDGVRIVFGYAGAAGNDETQEDVNANFGIQFVTEVAEKAELNEVAAVLNKAFSTDYRNGSAVPNGTNYDTLTTPGNYYVTSSSNANSMTNCPVKVSHRVIIFTTSTTGQVKQIVIANAAKMPIYVRNIGEAWYKLAVTSDTLITSDSQITTNNLPADDFNDMVGNLIYTMSGTATAAMSNHPRGTNNVAGADADYGSPQGTSISFKGATYNDDTAEVQMFFGQSGGNFSQPIMNFRTKFYSDNQWQWSPWAQFAGLFGVVRATNTFIQESRIQAGTADFDDMDNAPNNTIYQIDLDAVSMAHNPISGRSCVLITLSPSFVSNHGSLQLCGGLEVNDSYTPQLYFRYGYRQSVSEFRWTNWVKIAGQS